MAKQVGPLYIIGTIGDTVYFKRKGQYLCRRKSPLMNRERFYNDPAFIRFKEQAALFALAVKISGHVYRHLSNAQRFRRNQTMIIKKALELLKQKTSVKKIIKTIFQQYGVLAKPTSTPTTVPARVSRIGMTNSKLTFLNAHQIAAIQNHQQPLMRCAFASAPLIPQPSAYTLPTANAGPHNPSDPYHPQFTMTSRLSNIFAALLNALRLPNDVQLSFG